MNLLIFSALFLFVFALLNLYISKRLIDKLDFQKQFKHGLNLFLLLNFFGIVGYLIGRYFINIPSWLYVLLSVPIGVVFLLFCTAVIYDVSHRVLNKVPLSKGRRNFFKRSLDISSLGIAFAMSVKGMRDARDITIEHVDIYLDKLKRAYTVVQLSDLHIGGLIGRDFIQEVVQKCNNLSPDIVVITGDLVDIDVHTAAPILDELKNLKTSLGVYYVVGNHEYFHGIEKIIQNVKLRKIRVLENESVYVGEHKNGFNLAGVYDIFGNRMKKFEPNLSQALQNLDNDSPTILLAHQPKYIQELSHGVDLMLSGHTHGGQIYPFRFLVGLAQPYISGLHQHTKNLQIYVNKGTGFWGPPMRLGASSEITHIRLLPKLHQDA
jgi:hypothetical protein